jgi:hypothetical protein
MNDAIARMITAGPATPELLNLVPLPEGNSPDVRRGLVDTLLRENGERIRIVHGECDGAVGLLGPQKRVTYGEVIPGFSGILKTLLETKVGTAVEVP